MSASVWDIEIWGKEGCVSALPHSGLDIWIWDNEGWGFFIIPHYVGHQNLECRELSFLHCPTPNGTLKDMIMGAAFSVCYKPVSEF
jgi:hypothetical protein